MKHEEGVKFWFNTERVTEVTGHRIQTQDLEKPREG